MKTKNIPHTPVPWRAQHLESEDSSIIWDEKTRALIATCHGPGRKENAEFVRRACNSHEELAAALKALLSAAVMAPQSVRISPPFARGEKMADEAIAKAEGGK